MAVRKNDINWLHERFLQITCSDKKSIFIALLEKDNSASIRNRKLNFLAIGVFKFKRALASAPIKEMIPQNREKNMHCKIMLILLYHR